MVARVVLLLLLAAVIAYASARYTRTVHYDDEIVVRCHKDGPGVSKLLKDDSVDVWQYRLDGTVDARVAKKRYDALVPRPQCTLLIEDVEEYVRRTENVTTAPAAEWFEEYHRYDAIYDWYQKLAADYSDYVEFVETIGKSTEGRDMPAVLIGKGKNVVYSQCQIHAREWISGATCMYLANYLVENSNTNERVKGLLDDMKFVFVPFVNPDGYEYTWTNDRLWRKNRRKGTLCDGVDLNRNYNDRWGQEGSSPNQCSETYHGPSVESEPETKNTVNYFKTSGDIVGAIDWHSYSQLIIRPYGWTRTDSPDEQQLSELGENMKAAIVAVHGKTYSSIKGIDLYATTGTASDWFYTEDANSQNTYRAAGITIELRDTGRYGFELPASEIVPTGQEMVPAFLMFAEELNKNPLKF